MLCQPDNARMGTYKEPCLHSELLQGQQSPALQICTLQNFGLALYIQPKRLKRLPCLATSCPVVHIASLMASGWCAQKSPAWAGPHHKHRMRVQ